ncbi:hypothetical protein ARMGADRAFT_1077535 [Armillaria gallica]|uniref:Uncharacterized protein n=1 Tax=Armillaria gallica TaxID=47427 RepID=A0A2H3DQ70_ARMGA|nr:hypothetical protein ARMGADRAFT_1077535 [Armillaria gallica]
MAEPPVVKDAVALKHEALSAYEAAAVLLQHKVDFPPDKDSTSQDVDDWISEVYLQWTICSNFWRPAGVKKTVWNDAEYALLECLPLVDKSLIDDSRERFNALVHRAHKYSIPNLWPIPLDTPSLSPEPESRVQVPLPPKTKTLPPAPKPTTPLPQKEKTPVPQKQQSTAPITPQRVALRRTPSLVGSVPSLGLSAANPAATIASSNVQASGSAPFIISKPSLPKFTTPLTRQQAGRSFSSQRKVMPRSLVDDNTGPSDSSKAFQKDWTSPLHRKPAQQLKIGPPINASRSGASTRASSRVLVVNAADRSNIIRGPDPNLSPLREGSVVVPSSDCRPLFLPGTDDEEEPVHEDLVSKKSALFEDDGLADNFSGLDNDEPNPPQEEPMDLDGGEPPSDDEVPSPPPTNIARRLRQEPRISFVFDDVTGDFVESHPTIFLPRLAVPPASSQDLRRSACSHTSPVNPDTAYLKAILGSKVDAKKKKSKDVKNKDKASEAVLPRKRTRNVDDHAQVKDKPAPKKPKLKEAVVIEDNELAVATKVVRKRGPGLSRPPPVTLGISGGGFGEKVPSSAKVVGNGVKSIGVLVVDKDFGDFVEVDKSYWSKAVVPFVGERYTTPCDHCRRLGTQCRKLLTHTVKCVCCHYSKLPCKVDGVAALNPVEHYCPKGYAAVNTFEGALNAIEANNAAISEITQQCLVGLSVIAHTDSIRAQALRLRGCLAPVEDEADEENDEDDGEDDAPDDVAEGVAGPSTKKKGRSG